MAHPRFALTPLAAAWLTLAATTSFAQSAATPAPAASTPAAASSAPSSASPDARPDDRSGALQTVVITAEHHVADIQKTSISLVSQSGEEMREKGDTTLESVLSTTPAVTVMGSPQGGQVFIRGVGSQGDSNWVDPAISLNLDGVYSGRAERVFSSMYDVNRVEILRGPQGTLYGRNSTGGSVNVLTNDPKDKFEAGISGQLGNYDLHHVDGYLNTPLGDMFDLRVALMREKRDGYFTNGGRASDLTGERVKLLFKPTADFSLLATIDGLDSRGRGATTVPRAFSGGPPFFDWKTDYGNPWRVDDLHPADVQRTRFTTYSLQADLNLGFGTLTVLPAYVKSTRYTESDLVAGLAVPGTTLPLPASTWEEGQKTLEVRLASPESARVKWVVGAYAYDSANVETGVPSSYPPPTWEAYDTRVPATSRAVFGQLTIPLRDTLRLTAGLRYTRDDKTYHYGVQSTSTWTGDPYDSGLQTVSSKYDATTGKLGLEWDVTEQSLAYAQIASGYKAGGFGIAVPPEAYFPEHLVALELGSKNRFLDNRLQVNAEFYHYNYRNYQVMYADQDAPSPVPGDTTASFMQYVVNAGAGRNLGFEIETIARVTPDVELSAALAVADAHYGNFTLDALQGMDGARVVGTPRHTLTLGVRKDWVLGNGELSASAQTRLSDGYVVSLDSSLQGGTGNNYQDHFHKTDLQLNYTPDSDRWTAGVWLKNLENKAQTTEALPFGRAIITDPRTFGVNASYKF